MPPTEPAETDVEVVDGLPVLAEPAPVPAPRAATEVAVQAAAVAGASFVAGAGMVALLKSRKARRSALKLARGGRLRRRKGRLEVVGTRSFLVDVHLIERRQAIPAPRVEIEYCTQCRWLLRAGWMAQELLTTFPEELGEVALVPGTGGVFEIRLDGETIWSRAAEGDFPPLPQLKGLIRDRVAPERSLGHTDRRTQ